jgi:YegS/Rv2252/BmrU family lipid kinase
MPQIPFMDRSPMKVKVIVNPDSKPRRVKRYLKPSVGVLKENGFQVSIHFAKKPGEIQGVARDSVGQGFEAVIIAGGDGSLNEGINGIVGTGVPIGILPFGGSNVVARELGMPLHPVGAAGVIVKRRTRKIDLGIINDRYFAMMASCGYDAYAVSRTSMKIKKIIHRYAYVWAGLKDFMGYKPTLISLDLDRGKVIEQGTFVVIANTHYYGGLHQVTPYAEIDDGFLDVCVYKGKFQLGLVRFALNVLSKQHLSMKNVRYYRVQRVELHSSRRTLVQVDGDLLGELPMTAEIVPGAMDIFY